MAGGDRAAIRATAARAEIALVAVPFGATNDVVAVTGEALAGKTVIDVRTQIGFKLLHAN